jgi:hypothetical protein
MKYKQNRKLVQITDVSSPHPIWFCATRHMYPHGRRTCYQYASSFFSLSWFYPVGAMDSPLEPHPMTSTGTNPLPVG